MTVKTTPKQYMFEVQLDWLTAKQGVLSAEDAEGVLSVATPPVFGGSDNLWSPEHLFLGAISSCFMTTFLAFAEKQRLSIKGLECNITGQVEVVEGKFKFTTINLYPKIYIAGEETREKAALVLEKTHKYCLVSNSVNAEVIHNDEILVAPGYVTQKADKIF